MAFRTEHDSLGAVEVPAGVLYGAHTVRALANFTVSGVTLRERPAFIAALGHVKAAAARANAGCGVLDERLAGAIAEAAREVARGEHDEQFPIDIVQGGGGTAVNMNCNEVVANRANELLGGSPGAPRILPFTGTPHIRNDDYVVTLNTPQFSRFSGSLFYIWGHDENFYEWSPATIAFATYTLDWRPNDTIRISSQYQLQSYERRSDGTRVADGRIPRLKVEYQVSRAIFVRATMRGVKARLARRRARV